MDLRDVFVQEMESRIGDAKRALRKLAEAPRDYRAIEEAFRAFHTLKGSSSLLGYRILQKAFHRLEDVLRGWREDPSSVDPSVVSRLLDAVDFVFERSVSMKDEDLEKLEGILEGREEFSREEEKLKSWTVAKEFLEEILDEITEMETRLSLGDLESLQLSLSILKRRILNLYEEMEYVGLPDVLEGFQDMVLRDSIKLGKKAKLELRVEGAMIEREDAGVFRDALVHVVKNAIVHGIEPPQERLKAGKDETGTVRISAEVDEGKLRVVVEDDGRGIDEEKIKDKMKKLGIEGVEPLEAIFLPEFSTRDAVDEEGGRGVGLNAVKEFVEKRGGTVKVETERGKGTRFTIEIPIKRYLKRCLVFRRGESVLALELSDIDEVLYAVETFEKGGKVYVSHNGRATEVVDISKGNFRIAVVCSDVAVAADEVIGIRETSVRPPKIPISFVKGFAVGIERFPVPVIDPSKLSSKIEGKESGGKVLVVDDSPLTRLVVMRILERAGFDVKGAPNYRKALEMIRRENFDYAIVDLELPDGSGIDLVRDIKDLSPSTHVAVLTTADTEENRRRAEEAGADAFFSKGEDIDFILGFLRS